MITSSEVSTIIKGAGFELSDLLHRIDVLYASGNFTDEERTALIEEARNAADPQASLGPVITRVTALEEWRREVEARLSELEGGGTVDPGPEPGGEDEWPEYVQPTGAHDAYQVGDKITFGGKRYECVLSNCVWSPADYPQGWELVE